MEQHLGHIVNNGKQSTVLHASVMLFFYNFIKECLHLVVEVELGKKDGWVVMRLNLVTLVLN